jgi:hypothetical protein
MRGRKTALAVLLTSVWLIGPVVFLLTASSHGSVGFPLDDSWIHQTYARSLAEGRGWSYAGGTPSAGSTSPAWTFLQVPAHGLGCPPVPWSWVMGVLLLLANAVFAGVWLRTVEKRSALPAMVFILGEWHLVWASVSGMETLLFSAWICACIALTFRWMSSASRKNGILNGAVGALLGAGIWIRPEAVLFSATAILAVFAANGRGRWKRSVILTFGSMIPVLLYFAYEFDLHGRLWPNTFYAKPAEYHSLTAVDFLSRFAQPWLPLLAGAFSVLLPFLVVILIDRLRQRDWLGIWPMLWVVLHLLVFTLQLPVTYQHGRYYLPVLPILLGYSMLGFFRMDGLSDRHRTIRIFRTTMGISAAGLLAIFLWIGAGQYARDVEIIDTEMVGSSIWIRENTPPTSQIAAHDIGALGYFGDRTILDLGGLTDLDAMVLLSGKVSLGGYLKEKGADYLVTLPNFYSDELARCIPIWTPTGIPSRSDYAGVMSIYRWPESCIPLDANE